MKRIINGRLYDDAFMDSIESRSFDVMDNVTGETRTYRETLLREYVLKPGHTMSDTWVEGSYGRKIVRDNCDLARGQFVLKVSQGWNDGVFIVISDDEARRWLEKWCPDRIDTYVRLFGEPANPWTGSGDVHLVQQAEAKLDSARWDKERAEKRACDAEAKAERLRAELESLKAGRSFELEA